MSRKVFLIGTLLFVTLPLSAQSSLVKAGKKAITDATLKTSIETAVTQATSAAAKAAALSTAAAVVRPPVAAVSADYFYNSGASAYTPYGSTLGDYPDAQLAAFYKRVYWQLSEPLSSTDVMLNKSYDDALKARYRTLVGELQELNYEMANAVHGFLRGNRDLFLMEKINRTTGELTPQLAQIKEQIPYACAVQEIEKNMKYYSAAVMRMPFFEEKIESAFAYNKAVFDLSPAADVLHEADVLAIDDFPLPEQFHLAVVHDDTKVFHFFRSAQSNGYLPASWQVDVFENTAAFLQAHQATPYQLVISDRGLDDTFDKLVITLRHSNDRTPVIAHTAGISYDLKILYDKGYSAVFPILMEHPTEINLALKKYFYYAQQGLLPPVAYTAPARKITYP